MIYTELHLDSSQATLSVETNKFQFIIPNMAFPAVGFRVISFTSPPLVTFYIDTLTCTNSIMRDFTTYLGPLIFPAGFYTNESFVASFVSQVNTLLPINRGKISASFNRDTGFYTFTSISETHPDDGIQWPNWAMALYQGGDVTEPGYSLAVNRDNRIMANILGFTLNDFTDSFGNFLGPYVDTFDPSANQPSMRFLDENIRSYTPPLSTIRGGYFEYIYVRSNLGQILSASVLSSSEADSNIIARIPLATTGTESIVHVTPITPFYTHNPIYYNSIEIYLTNPTNNIPLALSGRKFNMSIGILVDNDVIKSK